MTQYRFGDTVKDIRGNRGAGVVVGCNENYDSITVSFNDSFCIVSHEELFLTGSNNISEAIDILCKELKKELNHNDECAMNNIMYRLESAARLKIK